jgi:hypothetical protein
VASSGNTTPTSRSARRSIASALDGVRHTVVEETPDVFVGEPVVDHPPRTAPRHDSALAEEPKLVAQRRLTDP